MKAQRRSKAVLYIFLNLDIDGVGVWRQTPATLAAIQTRLTMAQEDAWAPGTVWRGVENLAFTGLPSPDRPVSIPTELFRPTKLSLHLLQLAQILDSKLMLVTVKSIPSCRTARAHMRAEHAMAVGCLKALELEWRRVGRRLSSLTFMNCVSLHCQTVCWRGVYRVDRC
jgi:hypothetical protein